MITTTSQAKVLLSQIRGSGYRDDFELTFIMTTECNFRCTYCYETKYASSINLEDAYSLIDKLLNIQENEKWWNTYLKGCKEKKSMLFNFFGGECLLEVDKMTKICDYFKQQCEKLGRDDLLEKWKITIQTNGYLLQTTKVKKFLDKYRKQIDSPFITIDGCKEFHDACRVLKDGQPTYDVVKENLLWFRKTYPEKFISTKGTITPLTISHLYESYLAYKELGFTSITITLVSDQEWPESCLKIAKEQYALILQDLLKEDNKDIRFARWTDYRKNYINGTFRHSMPYGLCHSSGSGITLYPNGNLYPCFAYTPVVMSPINTNDYYIGTIKDGILTEKLDFIKQLEGFCDKKLIENKDCQVCLYKQHCDYCPATNLKWNKDTDVDSKNACEVIKIEQAYGSAYRYLWEKKYGKEPYWYFNN